MKEAIKAIEKGWLIGSGFMVVVSSMLWIGEGLTKLLHWAVCR